MVDVEESPETVSNFMKKNGYSFKVALDTENKASKRYGVTAHPVKFLLDEQGIVIAAEMGYRNWDTETSRRLLDGLLKELQNK